ncbi:MAG: tRNA (cytidine(34)-2'-O)-methyltransferase [Myxococcales bacterium]|nr:MAG: tRNA (cytidine(34)-2'-O)-methyltransferase [Myxococcales bacterium]
MPVSPKLRYQSHKEPFHIVLVEPEIPPNTGAIARTCAATQTVLHLVGPLGFRIDDQAVRRAGLDYWHLVNMQRHDSFEQFLECNPDRPLHFLSAGARKSYLQANFQAGDVLVFGKESVGLPDTLLTRYPEQCIAIPTLSGGVSSLNLSNAAALVLYEALRVTGQLETLSLSE